MSRPAPRIFISAAEPSADMYAAGLIRAARTRLPGAQFYGLAGPRMQAAGCQALGDLTGRSAMLAGIFKLLLPAWRAIRTCERAWRAEPPDLAIFLDSGTLHLPLARRARRMGLRTLYYVAPQTWASRAYRNRTLARALDHVACILPFEEEYFRSAGVRATFVGHPLFEVLGERAAGPARDRSGPTPATPVIALLPGSRGHVIERMLPLQLRVIAELAGQPGGHGGKDTAPGAARPGWAVQVAVSAADAAKQVQIERILRQQGVAAAIVVDDNASLLGSADLALVASGTATLEVAYYGTPMVVMYDAGAALRLVYGVGGRAIVRLAHLSLANILAGRRIVPEFMPFVRDPAGIARTVGNILSDEAWRRQIVSDLADVTRPLRGSSASARVCELIAALLASAPAERPRAE